MAIPVIPLVAGALAFQGVKYLTSGTKAEKWADGQVNTAAKKVRGAMKKKKSSNGGNM